MWGSIGRGLVPGLGKTEKRQFVTTYPILGITAPLVQKHDSGGVRNL